MLDIALIVRALSAAHTEYCHRLSCCLSLARQLHFAVLCDGALEELCGNAGAGLGLQRIPRHWLHFGEGEGEIVS